MFLFFICGKHIQIVFRVVKIPYCHIEICVCFSHTPRDLPPESPTLFTLQRSSGSVSMSEDLVMTVGDAEVRLRKSKKKKKRSSMIFITEERERTSTLDCKRVRVIFFLAGRAIKSPQEQEAPEEDEKGGDGAVACSLSPPSCQRSRNSAVTPTCRSQMRKV